MKTRTIILLITLLFVFNNLSMAQVPDPQSLLKEKTQLKTDLMDSYPQTVMEYNWMVEMWLLWQTSSISYTSFGEPSEITMVGSGQDTRSFMTYNAVHYNTETLVQVKEGGVWVDYERTTTVYGTDNMEESMISESWNGSSWEIDYGTKNEYTFDGNSVTGNTTQMWDRTTSQWINSSRVQYSYSGGSDNITEVIGEAWENGEWIKASKVRYIWDGQAMSEMYMSAWTDGAWSESSKMVFEIGDNESTVLTMYSGSGDGTWTPAQRFTDNIDSHGNIILSEIEFYGTEWETLMATQYLITYDGNNATERITKTFGLFEPENPEGTMTPTWRNVMKEVFSDFKSLSVNPLKINLETVQHYPNPAKEETILQLSNLKNKNLTINVLSLTGQLSLSEQVFVPIDEYRHTLNLGELSSGTFILTVKDESGRVVSSSRLMHQR